MLSLGLNKLLSTIKNSLNLAKLKKQLQICLPRHEPLQRVRENIIPTMIFLTRTTRHDSVRFLAIEKSLTFVRGSFYIYISLFLRFCVFFYVVK